MKRFGIFLSALCALCVLWSCQAGYQVQSYAPKTAAYAIVDSSYEQVEGFERMISPYRAQLTEKMERQIGTLAQDLPATRESAESTLGNFAADLLQVQSSALLDEPLALSVINFGGLRISLNEGPIYVRTIYELMPFDNQISLLKLKGETLAALFSYFGKYKNLAISNTKLVFTADGTLKEALINGEPVDFTQTYWVSASDYLADGGMGMTFFADALERRETGVLIRDTMIAYVEAQKEPIRAAIEGRAVFLSE